MERYERRKDRMLRKKELETEEDNMDGERMESVQGVCLENVEDECLETESVHKDNVELIDYKKEYNLLKIKYDELEKEKKRNDILTSDDFMYDNDKVRYFTGLNSYLALMALFDLISPLIKQKKNSALSKFQKLILCLCRLRLNEPITRLSYTFGISKSTVSKVFSEVIDILHVALQPLIYWPEKDELYATMPLSFQRNFRKSISVIIDCFEIFTDRPSNFKARSQTFSNYKKHNTGKYLIGITPQGSICFISSGWGGRVSDKFLTANSNFLNNIKHGDKVLADRGFGISELLALQGAELVIPSFTKGKKQLSAKEVETTRKIANVRIHVERVIGSVRQKYSILSSTIPIDYLMTKADEDFCFLDKIVFCCCALTNMCPSVVPFN